MAKSNKELVDILIERGVLVETNAYCRWGGNQTNHWHEYVKDTYGNYELDTAGREPVNCNSDILKPLFAIDETKL